MTDAEHPASNDNPTSGESSFCGRRCAGEAGDHQDPLIELVPQPPGVCRKESIPDGLRVGAEPGTAGQPIPNKPQHICPACDYLLTGLTTRRCPECGECFTLRDARIRAMQLTADVQRLRRKALRGRWLLVVGIVMGVFGILWPWHSYQGTAPPSALALSPRGYWMLIVTTPVSIAALITKTLFGRKWWEVVFAWGIVLMLMGLLASTK